MEVTRMARRLLRGLAAPALALALSGCADMVGERPEIDVSLVNLIPVELALLEQKIEVEVRVRNPNNHPIVLTGMRFDLDLNGKRILRGLSGRRVEIPRLGDALVRADGTTTTLSLLRQILEVQEPEVISYRLKGTAFVERLLGGSIPFENKGEIRLGPPRRGR